MYTSVYVCISECILLPCRNLGEECDDGDLLNGDGCSRACELEEGFNCGGEFRSTCPGLCALFGGVSNSYSCELLISGNV